MLVYNLTDKPLSFRGVMLSPDGGSFNFKDVKLLPARDLELVKKKVIALNGLPQWWLDERAVRAANNVPETPPAQPKVAERAPAVEEKKPVVSEDRSEQRHFRRK
jgi:hypothetical protein